MNAAMHRVLIVAYYYPPQPRAGALRPSYLTRHLAEFGWEWTVLTVAYGETQGATPRNVHPVAQSLSTARVLPEAAPTVAARRRSRVEEFVRGIARSVLFFPDYASSWYRPAVANGVSLGREQRFDAVLSTAPPITGHFVARSIANRLRIPWIADYRDLWSGPPTAYFVRNLGRVPRALGYMLERRLLRSAKSITTTTAAHRQGLVDAFGRTDAVVVPNACDLEAWTSIPDSKPTEFELCYAGAIHEGLRTPDPLFAAVAQLRQAGHPAGLKAKLHFYGSNAQLVFESAVRHGISDAVTVHGEVDRAVAMAAQRHAAVLVLLLHTEGTPDPIEGGNVGSKIFEYVGARRPVLAIGSPGSAGLRLVEQLGIGRCAFDVATCAAALDQCYADFVAGRIEPDLSPDFHPYTPRDLAADFAKVLNRAIE
jgi:glycosyltransferase involved in cell wall biosynthesis